MIGSRFSSALGSLLNSAVGSSADDESSSGWTVDTQSQKPFPSSAAEWAAFIAAKGLNIAVPGSLWLFQEPSGSVLDKIGTHDLAAAGTGSTYGSAITGFTRKGIATANAGTFALTNTDGTLPNISAASMTLLFIGQATANPSATRGLAALGVTTISQIQISTTSVLTAADGANTAAGVAAVTGAVRPYSITHKPTATTLARMATDLENLKPAFSASVTGQKIVISGTGTTSADPFIYTFGAAWYNTAGEIADADLRSLYTALGYTPAW